MRRRQIVVSLLACCLTAAVMAGGPQYVFTSFDPPGSTYTRGASITDAGTIVGYFNDTSGASHGYVRRRDRRPVA